MTITSEQLLTTLRWRYATKKFDSTKKIPASLWLDLEESLVLTPSSFGLQPWRFLVVNDPSVRSELQAESWGQAQVSEASHYVVLAARTEMSENDIDAWVSCMGEIQQTPAASLAGFRQVVAGFAGGMDSATQRAWNTRQVYIALGQLMASAAVLGLDTCPMEGINPAGYDRILKLEDSGYAAVVACAVGYRSADDKYATIPKARFSRSQVIRHI